MIEAGPSGELPFHFGLCVDPYWPRTLYSASARRIRSVKLWKEEVSAWYLYDTSFGQPVSPDGDPVRRLPSGSLCLHAQFVNPISTPRCFVDPALVTTEVRRLHICAPASCCPVLRSDPPPYSITSRIVPHAVGKMQR